MSETSQQRLLEIDTVLGQGKILLTGFTGAEGVSQLFQYDVELVTDLLDITAKSLLGTNATFWVNMKRGEGDPVYFNGMISQFSAASSTGREQRAYRARLVPWLWFLTRSADLRIFQNKSVIDIITGLFSELGYSAFVNETTGTYNPYDMKVQYRETDFAFVSRLMENEGIFYFFRHENAKHTLVLADHPSSFKPGPQAELEWQSQPGWMGIHAWQQEYELRTGKWTLDDFNFETINQDLTATKPTVIDNATMKLFEKYDYPGGYKVAGDGTALARARIEVEEAAYNVISGQSLAPCLQTGTTFKMKGSPIDAENATSVAVLRVHHRGEDTTLAMSGDAVQSYGNSFVCAAATQVYRPPLATPCPVVAGPQTAIVTGPSGEEIYVDKYGRIKVQFHWDRVGSYDDKSSFWVRVSQNWAGKQWGSQVLPRVGMEVIVEFLEGDPDRPIVTGCLTNANSMPPMTLPDERTRSIFRTQSSPGGSGYSEFSFQDKAGSEQIFLRGEKDFDSYLKNDVHEWVGKDRHLVVKGDKHDALTGDLHLKIGGDDNEKVGGTASMDVGTDIHLKAGQNVAIKGGMNVAIEAATMLSLKVGGNFVVIDSTGVSIVGTMVNINSGGSAGSLTAQPKAPKDAVAAADGTAGGAATAMTAKSRTTAANSIVWQDLTRAEIVNQAVQVAALEDAAVSGKPFCALCEAAKALGL